MLRQVLKAIESSNGSLSLPRLARQMEVEPSALRGMVEFWVRKGALKITGGDGVDGCGFGDCVKGHGCQGVDSCPFIVRLPQAISLVHQRK